MPLYLDEDEIIANRMADQWKQKYQFKFVRWMAEMDTPFWHIIMKDLMEKNFGPLRK